MRARLRDWLWRACLACLAPFAEAQETPFARVEVHVSAASSASVYLDRGSDAGIAAGDRVELYPTGQGTLAIVVRSVSKLSSRADLLAPLQGIAIGVRGEALVPRERIEQSKAQSESADHPPWTSPQEEWNDAVPLLAPAKRAATDEPTPRMHGRFFASSDSSWDHANGSRNYALYRTGGELTIDDLYQRGSSFEFDGEVNHRVTDVSGGSHDETTNFRVDRLSYTIGVPSDSAHRVQVGRFLQREFPELGILDGADVTWRTSSGDRFGTSVGFMPEPTSDLPTGKDFQSAVYYRYVEGDAEQFALGAALQKTWHDGTPDRDLVVFDTQWRATDRLYMTGSAWVDYYTASDTLKSEGFQVTEAHVSGNYTWPTGSGMGLFATYYRWPEIKRYEFEPVSDQGTRDYETTRVGLNAWHNLSTAVRLDAHVDYWHDQDGSGTGGELRTTVRDLICKQSQVSAAVFGNEGSFSTVAGGRFDVRYFGTRDSWGVSYELANTDQNGFNGTQASLAQDAVRASWDHSFEDGWVFSLYAEDRFGDQQDSMAAGFFLQRLF